MLGVEGSIASLNGTLLWGAGVRHQPWPNPATLMPILVTFYIGVIHVPPKFTLDIEHQYLIH